MASATSCLFDPSKNEPKLIIAILLASPGVMPNSRERSSATNLRVFHVVVLRDKLRVNQPYLIKEAYLELASYNIMKLWGRTVACNNVFYIYYAVDKEL